MSYYLFVGYKYLFSLYSISLNSDPPDARIYIKKREREGNPGMFCGVAFSYRNHIPPFWILQVIPTAPVAFQVLMISIERQLTIV